jgi:hypothetical protein
MIIFFSIQCSIDENTRRYLTSRQQKQGFYDNFYQIIMINLRKLNPNPWSPF